MKCPICKGEMDQGFDNDGIPICFCDICGISKPDYSRRRIK